MFCNSLSETHKLLFYKLHLARLPCLSLLQTLPSGKPSLVQPTLHKIDVEALKKDIKKFEENYPARVSRAWSQWVQDIDKLLELPSDWVWPLEILQNCSKVRTATEDVPIPDHLQALRDKETVETQQVCFCV